ncbi:MAG: Gfo/Idh/MocA family oxidoreductase [Firmicutes bacterium]|nr:Gfo/Idh/MocA family oxidoreductase [Bacillota bacterium]
MKATFKPHHFLDFLYELAENGGVFDTFSPYGHIMGYYGNLLSAGKIDTIVFTSGADDPCAPCRKLNEGICADLFPPDVAARYGVDRKYDYNLKLDLTFHHALPDVFPFDQERSIDEVFSMLQEKLTPEIILLNWPRENRVKLTYRGLAMAISARANHKKQEEGSRMKIAILGVWHVHAAGYCKTAMENGEVVGFYEPDDALAAEFQKECPVPRFASLDELLTSDAEGVIVCSATNEHPDTIIRAAKAGKRIFTEKVLALTSAQCEEIETAFKENGTFFTISYPQKYFRDNRAVIEVAKSGELGKINFVRFRNCHNGSSRDWLPPHFYNQAQCGGGAMIDLGAHGMYLIHQLLGLPSSAVSQFTRSCTDPGANAKNTDGVEDNAVTVMQYENGAIAVNETGFVTSYAPPIFEVYGEKGWVKKEGKGIGEVTKCTETTNGEIVSVPLAASLPSPLEQFLSGEPAEGCGITEAKALTRMMELAYGQF